ncbi:MAG: hypothetical protein J5672_04265, partial [Verrucomicrobia bacterium]|nr:hypothetical protein [Verrucomicrobiota bacterium]
ARVTVCSDHVQLRKELIERVFDADIPVFQIHFHLEQIRAESQSFVPAVRAAGECGNGGQFIRQIKIGVLPLLEIIAQ